MSIQGTGYAAIYGTQRKGGQLGCNYVNATGFNG